MAWFDSMSTHRCETPWTKCCSLTSPCECVNHLFINVNLQSVFWPAGVKVGWTMYQKTHLLSRLMNWSLVFSLVFVKTLLKPKLYPRTSILHLGQTKCTPPPLFLSSFFFLILLCESPCNLFTQHFCTWWDLHANQRLSCRHRWP